ncbi:MAG: hypothetical protein NUV84_00105 [Candidatus Uhrbacteria bacterium]|nr:hypothetical protein [Candidatus Uhrbacteria bacterium]
MALGNPMDTHEGRLEIRTSIELWDINRLNTKIAELAQQCSVITQRLHNDQLSDTRREELVQELKTVVNEGSKLADERKDAVARLHSL